WHEMLTELERVRSLRPDLDTVRRVAALVEASGAPKWAARLREEACDGVRDPWTPEDWRESWQLRRVETYLQDIDGRERLALLATERREKERLLERAVEELVEQRTHLGLLQRMTPARLSALQRFATAIRLMPKSGTGVRSYRY